MNLFQTFTLIWILLLLLKLHISGNFFTTNVNLTGFKEFYTPSNSSKGGAALYVKEIYEAFERKDLKSQNDYFESVWIEVKNKHKKNMWLHLQTSKL